MQVVGQPAATKRPSVVQSISNPLLACPVRLKPTGSTASEAVRSIPVPRDGLDDHREAMAYEAPSSSETLTLNSAMAPGTIRYPTQATPSSTASSGASQSTLDRIIRLDISGENFMICFPWVTSVGGVLEITGAGSDQARQSARWSRRTRAARFSSRSSSTRNWISADPRHQRRDQRNFPFTSLKTAPSGTQSPPDYSVLIWFGHRHDEGDTLAMIDLDRLDAAELGRAIWLKRTAVLLGKNDRFSG